MPIYEFCCDSCGKEFEIIAKNDESPVCPECGSAKTTKLMSCCARKRQGAGEMAYSTASSGGCSGCSGGNCASCGR